VNSSPPPEQSSVPINKYSTDTDVWQAAWYGERRWSYWLLPLTGVFVLLSALRRYVLLNWKQKTLATPVIVVGNISVGGTGKTPLLIALVQWLQAQGYTPGVVSRGYGGAAGNSPYLLSVQSTAAQAGDEPITIYQQTGCAVCISADRVAAARVLEDQGCDILLSDDGLQHYRMGRDIEIAVVDGQRGLGNGWRMPVGPLREPISRLKTVDWVVVNSPAPDFTLPQLADLYFIPMQIQACALVNLVTGDTHEIAALQEQPVNAVAGIGNPQRFINTLNDLGISAELKAFPDHHAYTAEDFQFDNNWPVVMTEKDAVKCKAFAQADWYYLPIKANLPDAFWSAFAQRIAHLIEQKKSRYGF
jgi:tetraacyldisaccharide 4'-kinase